MLYRLPLILAVAALPAAAATTPPLDKQFTQTVRPFLTKYCIGCHSGATPAAQIDFKSYSTLDSVVRDFPHWATALDKLNKQQMPPKPVPQPPDDVRKQVTDWIRAVRLDEIKRHAGDPGVVMARRLSNSEYNYTVRDLTGVDIQPAREFPVDPANQAGFDNSGESLTMSPALLKKYLQAAREVSDRMVLTPDGIDFAPYPMLVETDREKFAVQRIVNFYLSQPTDYADYFQAAWRFKHRAELGKPNATLAGLAAEAKLSPKYLPVVWQLLEDPKDPIGPVGKLQTMWKALPAPGGTDAALRTQCIAMRDFVVKIRKDTAMQFVAPKVKGLPAASEPLLNWKLKQFAAHRRDSDPAALRNDTDPPPVVPTIPKLAGLHQEAATRWAALMAKSRAADPDLVVPAAQRDRYQAAFQRFAQVFPDNFFISERGRFFPDDSEDKGRLLSAGYHSVVGFYRDDTPLMELILDDQAKKQLDRLWTEFDYMAAYTSRTWVQYFFNQAGEIDGKGAESEAIRPPGHEVTDEFVINQMKDKYLVKALADPNNDPAAAEAIKYHFTGINATLRGLEKMHTDAEPKHLDAVLKFAARAYRRPLTKAEQDDILANYHKLRDKNALSHEDAIRESIAGILMSPDYCFRIDLAPGSPVTGVKPLSGYALASRLSYFLWSSMPDAELMKHAAAGDLSKPAVLIAEARRMLKDDKALGLVTEFGGNWLDFRHFEQYNSADRERFPAFTNDLREAMYQEPIHLLADAFRNDRSALDLLYGNYTFVNPTLAKFYGMPDVKGPDGKPAKEDTWVRVDNADRYQRGGLLPMAVFQTQNSPGLRTSPVKRGYWVVRRVLGEVIPPPPPVVPELPADESKSDLPLRDKLAQHRSNPVCAGCHARFDSLGLAFEGYGPVGDLRTKDMAGRPIDASSTFPGGIQGAGYEGVLSYVRDHRQADYLDNLSRKMLAYALNRSLVLSDEGLIDEMNTRMAANGYKMSALVEAIVTSPQFRNKRWPDAKIQSSSTDKSAPKAVAAAPKASVQVKKGE
jgi:hypothetical protein